MFTVYATNTAVRSFATFAEAEILALRLRRNYYLIGLFIETPTSARINY